MDRAEQLLAALILEAALGYPQALHRRLPHPVVGIGMMITALDLRWNKTSRGTNPLLARLPGIATLAMLIMVSVSLGLILEHLLFGWTGAGLVILLATTGFAQKSLHDHVAAVFHPLAGGDLPPARGALSMIVGRDTQSLDEQGIAAAAIESLAESFCDGIVAPAFWFLLAGLPGLLAFKAISTADSLIGHMDKRYRYFGWASARTDDVLNFIPARLAGILLCMAGAGGWRIMWRDAGKHLSPNAGWPEAAMAGALNIRLGGGAAYDGEWIDRALLGKGPRPKEQDLGRALTIYRRACLLLWFIAGGLAWAL